MEKRDVIIIGGGPAGLAAAVELKKNGVEDILVIEREKQPGGRGNVMWKSYVMRQ